MDDPALLCARPPAPLVPMCSPCGHLCIVCPSALVITVAHPYRPSPSPTLTIQACARTAHLPSLQRSRARRGCSALHHTTQHNTPKAQHNATHVNPHLSGLCAHRSPALAATLARTPPCTHADDVTYKQQQSIQHTQHNTPNPSLLRHVRAPLIHPRRNARAHAAAARNGGNSRVEPVHWPPLRRARPGALPIAGRLWP